ncbi:MAG: ABC transporter ATP-binding protein [Clostridiales bacterium]|nr:ABC transporter ATP-binding protein [Clostridiales bacterium]
MAILECKGLTKKYGAKEALRQIDLQIEPGRIVGLLGPNGSGKSTLLKICTGLLTPTKGAAHIDGRKPDSKTKAIVSYLPEVPYLNDWMKVSDIVAFFHDFYSDFNLKKALDMLNNLSIENQALKTLSKGTKEKVQLVLVMAREAKLYLLDEPIGGVDPAARDYILNTIIRNYNPEAAVVLSTHLITDIEQVLDDVVFLKDGEIVLDCPVDELRESKGMSVDAYFREVFKC